MSSKLEKCITLALSSNFHPTYSLCCSKWNKINTKLILNPGIHFTNFALFPAQSVSFFYHKYAYINRMLKNVQESSPKAFKIGKTPELPGRCPLDPKAGPWTPPVMARALLSSSINFFFDRQSFKNDG